MRRGDEATSGVPLSNGEWLLSYWIKRNKEENKKGQ